MSIKHFIVLAALSLGHVSCMQGIWDPFIEFAPYAQIQIACIICLHFSLLQPQLFWYSKSEVLHGLELVFHISFNKIATAKCLKAGDSGLSLGNAFQVLARLCRPDQAHYGSLQFTYYLQYQLHRQLLAVANYAAKHGVALKGDLPIGNIKTFLGVKSMEIQEKFTACLIKRRLRESITRASL